MEARGRSDRKISAAPEGRLYIPTAETKETARAAMSILMDLRGPRLPAMDPQRLNIQAASIPETDVWTSSTPGAWTPMSRGMKSTAA